MLKCPRPYLHTCPGCGCRAGCSPSWGLGFGAQHGEGRPALDVVHWGPGCHTGQGHSGEGPAGAALCAASHGVKLGLLGLVKTHEPQREGRVGVLGAGAEGV